MRMSQDERARTVEALPIACSLSDALAIEERRASIEKILAGATTRRELVDGYEFVFPGGGDWAERLMQFVATERKCCPFFIFELLFEQALGPIHLRLRGAAGVKDFLNDWLKAIVVAETIL